MTYNVFGGTLNLLSLVVSINITYLTSCLKNTVPTDFTGEGIV